MQETLGPFIIAVRNGGVPAIKEIEFAGDLVSYSQGRSFSAVDVRSCRSLVRFNPRIVRT